MKFWSDSWTNGDRIPPRHAAGLPGRPLAPQACGENVNPHLAWCDLPAGTASLVLLAHDFDMPAGAAAGAAAELPPHAPREDFFHWVLVDLPPRPAAIAEGAVSRGFVPGGRREAPTPAGGRHGRNDFTRWCAADAALAGEYFGFDGPCPPVHDTFVHHVVFTLYALALPRLPLEGVFDGAQVSALLAGPVLGPQVLAVATFSGTCTLNPRLLAEAP
jgi:Raf kinase inhibitor-like YbhB/YbcL family protein